MFKNGGKPQCAVTGCISEAVEWADLHTGSLWSRALGVLRKIYSIISLTESYSDFFKPSRAFSGNEKNTLQK